MNGRDGIFIRGVRRRQAVPRNLALLGAFGASVINRTPSIHIVETFCSKLRIVTEHRVQRLITYYVADDDTMCHHLSKFQPRGVAL